MRSRIVSAINGIIALYRCLTIKDNLNIFGPRHDISEEDIVPTNGEIYMVDISELFSITEVKLRHLMVSV